MPSFLQKLSPSALRGEQQQERDAATAYDDSAEVQSMSNASTANLPQAGVIKAEAAKAVAGHWIYVAWLGIALVSYCYGLDNNTLYAYLQAAATRFEAQPLYSSISVVQQVLIGVIKLPVAKFSDVIGRAEAYTISVTLYVLGFIIIASSQSLGAVFAGVVFQAMGNTGTQIMQQIVLADWVPAQWRGFAIGIVSYPYIINFAIAPRIVGALCPFATCPTSNGWRWGAGMFTIMLPIAASPIIMVLALSQRRVKQQHVVRNEQALSPVKGSSLRERLWNLTKDFDVPGLVLIIAGWLLILLPLQLHAYAPNDWDTGYIIAMLVVGGVCLVAVGIWEGFFSPRPIIRRTYIVNKNG